MRPGLLEFKLSYSDHGLPIIYLYDAILHLESSLLFLILNRAIPSIPASSFF